MMSIAFYQSIWAAIPLSAVGVYIWKRDAKKYRQKCSEQFAMQFTECILSVTTALQAGYSIENAFLESREDMLNLFGEKSFIYLELEYIRRGLVMNRPIENLLEEIAKRREVEDVEQFTKIFMIAKKKGGNLPEIMHRTADMIHRKMQAMMEIEMLLAGKELEQKILKCMPFMFLIYMGVAYPGYFGILYHNLQGIGVMTACLSMYLAACVMSNRILDNIQKELMGKNILREDILHLNRKQKESSLKNRVEGELFHWIYGNGNSFICSKQVTKDLKSLYPEEKLDVLKKSYYVMKTKLMILVIFGGVFFSWAVCSSNEEEANRFAVYVIGTIGLSAAMFFMKDQDLHKQVEKQKDIWKMQYPDLVHKVVLYLGAGMSMRGCFGMLASEYDVALYVRRELETGQTEAVAYDRFGKRTGVLEYMRFCTLLVQNLKKGSKQLLHRLEEEADKSAEERVRTARTKGEEASTRLLVPMTLLLASVMLMIMAPAFWGMDI